MIELRFHRALYAGTAVDAAARVFERFATIALVEEPAHWVVRVSAGDPDRERAVAGELGNHALGRTVAERPVLDGLDGLDGADGRADLDPRSAP